MIPHLTVAQDGDAPADEFADISDNLPIACDAREIWLMSEDEDRQWRAQSTFPLADDPRG